MKYTRNIPYKALGKVVTWAETLEDHLVNGVVSQLKRDRELTTDKYCSFVDYKENCIVVTIET